MKLKDFAVNDKLVLSQACKMSDLKQTEERVLRENLLRASNVKSDHIGHLRGQITDVKQPPQTNRVGAHTNE